MAPDPIIPTGATEADAAVPAGSNPPSNIAADNPIPLTAVPPVPAPAQQDISADIAKILKDVKLPERRKEKIVLVPEGQGAAFGALPSFSPQAAPAAPTEQEIPKTIVPPTAPDAPKAEENIPSSVVSLHTMKNDLQDVVRDRKISVVRAASMEQERHSSRPFAEQIVPRRSGGHKIGIIITAIILLLALAGAALYGLYFLQNESSASQAPVAPAILFAEDQVTLPLDNQSPEAIKQTLATLIASPQGAAGSITQIIPTLVSTDSTQTQRPATLSEFFAALGANPPPDLLRALSDQFFFGVHAADEPSPVFVIPVISYDRAFAGMLAWEATMDSDLSPPFKLVPAITENASSSLPQARQFQDLVQDNYDVRALEDDSGTIVLYYSFPTPDILIITASTYTFPEVLSRLQAQGKL